MKAHFYSFDGEREQLRFTLVLKDGYLSIKLVTLSEKL